MIIASAQTIPKDGDIDSNIQDHCRMTLVAADSKAQLVLFPEMSLTGYMLGDAAAHAFQENDTRLQPLQEISDERNIIIIAGAPITTNDKLHIGAFILQPNKAVQLYTKQFLHTGEEVYFEPGDIHNPVLEAAGEKISVAICADITSPLHPENAAKKNTTLYVAGIFYSPGGLAEGYDYLSSYAKLYNMHVLMANYGGPSCQIPSGGQSAYWNKHGKLIVHASKDKEELLIIDTCV